MAASATRGKRSSKIAVRSNDDASEMARAIETGCDPNRSAIANANRRSASGSGHARLRIFLIALEQKSETLERERVVHFAHGDG